MEAARRRAALLLSLPPVFPRQTLTLNLPDAAVRHRRTATSSPAAPRPADLATSSASTSATSPRKELGRGARNRRIRPRPSRADRRRPTTIPSPSGLPVPCRRRHHLQGEQAHLPDPLALPLSLSVLLAPCSAARRRSGGHRSSSGSCRRLLCSSLPPLAHKASARVQFHAYATNSCSTCCCPRMMSR